MQVPLTASLLLMAVLASALPASNPNRDPVGPFEPPKKGSRLAASGTGTGVLVEAAGTDVVAGGPSDTKDPGKTIFVPSGGAARVVPTQNGNGPTVIPTQLDPAILAAGGESITITGGSDGVVII